MGATEKIPREGSLDSFGSIVQVVADLELDVAISSTPCVLQFAILGKRHPYWILSKDMAHFQEVTSQGHGRRMAESLYIVRC